MDSILRQDVIIEADELLQKLGNENLRILDATVVTNQADGVPDALTVYQQTHVSGAAFFNHAKFADSESAYSLMIPAAEDLARAIGNIGISNNSEVVVYSTSMLAWATRVWWLLKYAGFDNVRVLNGGLKAWQDVGGAVESGDQNYAPTTFSANIRSEYFVNKEQMAQASQDEEIHAVHSLPKPMFDQAHIPSSVCQPCTDFLDNGTSLLPDDQLKERLIANNPTGKTITYCGGGVAATVNAVVCRLVGNPDVAVYDGSMSEWMGEGMPVNSVS